MLLAEIRGKFKRPFACRACGDESAVDALRSTGIEDALTSYIFGALRHLPTSHGAGVLYRRLSLSNPSDEHFNVDLWPFHRVWIRLVDAETGGERGCEPDVVLDSEAGVVVVETKLGMRLGSDPSQLPREARLAHAAACGRPWRLLCITADIREPTIASFAAVAGKLALAAPTTVAKSVASYFEAEKLCGDAQPGPMPEEVLDSVYWLGWRDVSSLLEQASLADDPPRSSRALLLDLVALLDRRGLTRRPFHGFGQSATLLTQPKPTWTIARRNRRLWSSLQALFVPSKLTWSVAGVRRVLWASLRTLHAPSRLPRLFGGLRPPFSSLLSARITPWPATGWLRKEEE